MRVQLTDKDYEVFSAYLDDQLDPGDKTRLEAKLQAEPELRIAFNEIAATRALLRKAKQYRAPRNFTLSAETAQKYRRKSFFSWLPAYRFSMVMSALSLVIVLVLEVTSLLPMGAAPQYALAPAAAPMQAEKAIPPQATQAPRAAEATMEIQWQPAPAIGMGGGAPDQSSNEISGSTLNVRPGSGGGSDPVLGQGGGGQPPESPLLGPIQLPAQSVKGMNNSTASTAIPPEAQPATAADQSTNPILGIRPEGDGGKMITSNGDLAEVPDQPAEQPLAQAEPAAASALPPRRTAELALLAFAVVAGAAAFLIRRRSQG